MIVKRILTVVLLFYTVSSFAQKCELGGKVIDKTSKNPIAYASVALFTVKDSVLSGGTITDDKGEFLLKQLKMGEYWLKVSFIGYQSVVLKRVLIQPGKRTLEAIPLAVLSKNIGQVVVRSTTAPITYKVDRKVIDAESYPGADHAVDLLKNVPSIHVDAEGNITYRNDGTFKVYINGHPVANGEQKLQQLPASQIAKVEIITNPSAKYDAEGTAGIIQVILKKTRLEGYAVNVQATANTLGAMYYYFSVDYKKKKNGWYIHGFSNKSVGKKTTISEQTIDDDEGTHVTNSDLKSKEQYSQMNLEAGFNYDLTAKDYIDFSAYINPEPSKNIYKEKGWVNEQLADVQNEIADSSYYYNSFLKMLYQFMGATLTYKHSFDRDQSHVLSAYIDYSGYVNDLKDKQLDELSYDTGEVERQGYLDLEHNEKMIEAKLDYKQKFAELLNLELGFDVNTNHIPKITTESGDFDEADELSQYSYELQNQKVNFAQDIYAPYLLLKHDGDKLGIQAGLRMEYTNRRADYVAEDTEGNTINVPNHSHFTDFFPSAHLSYNLGNNHQVYISYSHRINRPDYWSLVPVIEYTSPYSYGTGNGDLLPEYTNAYEAGYSKSWDKDFLSADVYYRKTKNVIQQISTSVGENTLENSPENVGYSQNMGFELMTGVNLFAWWNTNFSSSVYAYKLQVNYDENDYSRKQFSASFKWTNTFLLPKDFTCKIYLDYNSPEKTAQIRTSGYYFSTMNLSKKLNDGKWKISLTAIDPFKTRHYKSVDSGTDYLINESIKYKNYFSLKVAYSLDHQK